MLAKKIIAVDLDDVVADTTEALRIVANAAIPKELALSKHHYKKRGNYWGYYEGVWRENKVDHLVSFDNLHDDMAKSQHHVQLVDGAKEALKKLSGNYKLVAVTSRRVQWINSTQEWLNDRLPGIFGDVVFVHHDNTGGRTKGDACKEIGAHWLIDDNPEHCLVAKAAGTIPLLFGEYGWTDSMDVVDIVHVASWQEVLEYFENEG